MTAFWASLRKEFLVLIKDIPGLLILFLLPVVMIIVVTLVQHSTFEQLKGSNKTSLLFADADNELLGQTVKEGLEESNNFKLETTYKGLQPTADAARKAVIDGDYKIALVIPEGTTERLRKKIKPRVNQVFDPTAGIPESENDFEEYVELYTDPSLQISYRHYLLSSLNAYGAQIENKILFRLMQEELEKMTGRKIPEAETRRILVFKERPVYAAETDILPNSTQHNVPAWTMFAMFFIVIPLAGSMIKERQEGSFTRIISMPGSYGIYLGAKSTVYLGITGIQFILMILAGILILPALGLPVLTLGSSAGALLLMMLASGLAAVGYGIAVGTLSSTQEQAGVFGSVSVIILAALGGIWYPVYAMPENVQLFSALSPLNWGLTGFYKIFIKDLSLIQILPQAALLLGFYVLMTIIAVSYEKVNRLSL